MEESRESETRRVFHSITYRTGEVRRLNSTDNERRLLQDLVVGVGPVNKVKKTKNLNVWLTKLFVEEFILKKVSNYV